MGNENLYLLATNEMDGNNHNAALWAKALALAQGDEKNARYKYIELRVEQLEETNTVSASTEESAQSPIAGTNESEQFSPPTPSGAAPNHRMVNKDLGFIWWQVWGWLGLTVGNVMALVYLHEAIGWAFLLIMLNTTLMVLILTFNKYGFLIATILSLNPLLWIINGIYLKKRWNHPRVNSVPDAADSYCEDCGAKVFVNYGDASHVRCKNCN